MQFIREKHVAARLPADGETRIWRYMDLWKFESLVNSQALYLCRGGKLQDRFEGTWPHQQRASEDSWLESIGRADLIQKERVSRELRRKRFFVSCWCMNEHDLDLMWKAYTSDSQSVAIQSTVDRLVAVADEAIGQWPIDVSTVAYIDYAAGVHINNVDGFDAFVHKDVHFKLDSEIRIIHWPNIQEPVPDGILLPVKLSTLIEKITFHPGSRLQLRDDLRALLEKAGLSGICCEASRDHRDVIY